MFSPRYEMGIYVKQITCVLKGLIQVHCETVLFHKNMSSLHTIPIEIQSVVTDNKKKQIRGLEL